MIHTISEMFSMIDAVPRLSLLDEQHFQKERQNLIYIFCCVSNEFRPPCHVSKLTL